MTNCLVPWQGWEEAAWVKCGGGRYLSCKWYQDVNLRQLLSSPSEGRCCQVTRALKPRKPQCEKLKSQCSQPGGHVTVPYMTDGLRSRSRNKHGGQLGVNPDSVIRWQCVHVHMCACALFMCTCVHACMCLCACVCILSPLNLNPVNSKMGHTALSQILARNQGMILG